MAASATTSPMMLSRVPRRVPLRLTPSASSTDGSRAGTVSGAVGGMAIGGPLEGEYMRTAVNRPDGGPGWPGVSRL